MPLPSRTGGPTTRQVGYFAYPHRRLAEWLVAGLGSTWRTSTPEWQSTAEAASALAPAPTATRYACVAIGDWTVVLNNAPWARTSAYYQAKQPAN